MAKNYILEPVELTFEDSSYKSDSVVFPLESILSIPEDAVAQINDQIFKFNKIDAVTLSIPNNTYCIFTPNGKSDDGESEDVNAVVFRYVVEYSKGGKIVPEHNEFEIYLGDEPVEGTYTVSIYTETEDGSDSKPYIDEKLSKNVTYTDHPHNNWEEVLNKKGDPKTGYNTIEKLASSTSEGGSDDGSSGGSGVNILHGEFNADGKNEQFVRITDAGPFEASDEGEQKAIAFLEDLATKQTFVVFNINGITRSWPVTEIYVNEGTFRCINIGGSGDSVMVVNFTPEVIDDLIYFVAYLSQ